MSALALSLKQSGELVIGSDKEETYFTEKSLNDALIPIFNFNKNNIIKYNTYVYIISYAYDENNNEEVKEIINRNYKYYYYSDFINEYYKNIKIGISGTHGKTTVTTMIKTLFKDEDISYIIGDGNGGGCKDSKYLIFEACEYKHHFINYDYDYLVINNIDYDHPDFFNNIDEVINAFKIASKKAKCVIINNDDNNVRKIKHNCRYTYGINKKSFVTGTILNENNSGYKLKVVVKEKEYILSIPLCGIHNVYNFLASFTVYYLTHSNKKNIENYINDIMKEYVNPKRRVEEIHIKNNNILIDDYAHHPKEIECSYNSIKQKYPYHNITIVYQPHTYSRTFFLSNEFIEVFKNKDVYLMSTFASREEQSKLKDKLVFDLFINIKLYDIETIKDIIDNNDNQIIIFMGAGNINKEINKFV